MTNPSQPWKRKLLLGLGLGLAALLLAEVAAQYLLPRVPGCNETPRNAGRFRGWPEYVAGIEKITNASLVVLISNSQAYAGEYPANNGYPAFLAARLNQQAVGGRTNWVVANWSLDGVTSMEYMMLATLLQRHKPLLLMVITGSADFQELNFESSFSFCRTDLPRLLAQLQMVRGLPLSFWKRHWDVEDVLSAWVIAHCSLLQYRDYYWSWLDARLPGAQYVYYAPQVHYRYWPVKAKAWVAPPHTIHRSEEMIDVSYTPHSGELLQEYLRQLGRVQAPYTLVAAGPMREGLQAAVPGLAQFMEDLEAGATAQGFRFANFAGALPAEDFLTSSHLKVSNHRRFADILVQQIREMME